MNWMRRMHTFSANSASIVDQKAFSVGQETPTVVWENQQMLIEKIPACCYWNSPHEQTSIDQENNLLDQKQLILAF